MINYKARRIVDKLKWVIIDENGKVINRNPSKEELKGLNVQPRESQDTRKGMKTKKIKICCNCESHDTYINPGGIEY